MCAGPGFRSPEHDRSAPGTRTHSSSFSDTSSVQSSAPSSVESRLPRVEHVESRTDPQDHPHLLPEDHPQRSPHIEEDSGPSLNFEDLEEANCSPITSQQPCRKPLGLPHRPPNLCNGEELVLTGVTARALLCFLGPTGPASF